MKENNWTFDSSIASIFPEHVRKSVFAYDQIHGLVANIAPYFITDDSNIYDVGCSLGESLVNIQDKNVRQNVKFIGLDTSDAMIKQAKENHPDFDFRLKDITSGKCVIENASLITSILTLQFIPINQRLQVLNKIRYGLNDGGCFILVEKVIDDIVEVQELYTDLYYDFKIENGFTEKEIYEKRKSLAGVMRPLQLNENIELLQKAGFEKISIFFKYVNFCGILCIK